MGIKNDLQKKKHLKKSNTYKKYNKNTKVKVSNHFYIELWIFLLQNSINYTFYNLYYDYWDLITKFCLGSTKWNTPFTQFFLWVLRSLMWTYSMQCTFLHIVVYTVQNTYLYLVCSVQCTFFHKLCTFLYIMCIAHYY